MNRTYTYDAENRLIAADGGAVTYQYDASGRRVRKVVAGSTTEYVLDLEGRVVQEYGPSLSLVRTELFAGGQHLGTYRDGATYFSHADWLGTERARTNMAGAVVETFTSLPFGDALSSQGGVSPLHFTGKERDAESGLDYFRARYYGSNMGRWMSPDWSGAPEPVPYARLDDPQTLNLYSYVRNNPLSSEDPDGHGILDWLKKQGCNLGASSLCAPEQKEQQQDQQQQEQELINAQDNARNNPAFQPSGGTTHCNQATCAIVQQTGAPTAPLVDKNGKPVSANQQAQNLANSNQYREVTPQEAQQIANKGGVVIVAYDNPHGHGHTATVRPEGVSGDNPPPGGRGPLINDVGRTVGVHNANYTFRKGTEVHYYTPRGKQ